MKFHREDRAQAGVVLHFSPRAPISEGISKPIRPGHLRPSPASAILWNQSGKAIRAFTLIWTPSSTQILGVGPYPSLFLLSD
jgi:hypothetical protein